MNAPIDTISNRIKQGLSMRDLSQQDLSDRTGIPKSSISQYVSGIAKPKADRLHLIATALKVSETWLLGFDVDTDGAPTESQEPPEALKIDHAYLSLAKDAQDKGIDPEDIRKAIEFLEDIRNGRV